MKAAFMEASVEVQDRTCFRGNSGACVEASMEASVDSTSAKASGWKLPWKPETITEVSDKTILINMYILC